MRTMSLALLALMMAPCAKADDATLSLELNAAETVNGACRISLLVENGLQGDIAALGVEAVLFGRDGRVLRLLTLDLEEAPKGRPRLRQFDLPGLDCATVGRMLVNSVAPCTGEGLDAATCQRALALRSRVAGLEVLG